MELISPVETIDADEPLSKALQKFEDHELLIVTKEGRYFGELVPEMLLRFKGDADSARAGRFARKGSALQLQEAELPALVKLFSGGSVRFVSVLERNGKLAGVVSAESVLKYSEAALSGRSASEYAKPVTAIPSGTAADKAEEMMFKQGVGELAVLEKGKFIGIISARDLAVKVKPYLHKKRHDLEAAAKVDVEKVAVSGILTPEFELAKVGSGESIADALHKAKFGEAFVFDGEKLVGKIALQKVLSSLKAESPMHVEISGLTSEEAMFKESIFEECSALLRKFGKGGSLHLRIRSARKGKESKIYEVHGRLEMDGKAFVSTTREMKGHRGSWELGSAVSEVLKELKKAYLRKKKAGKTGRGEVED